MKSIDGSDRSLGAPGRSGVTRRVEVGIAVAILAATTFALAHAFGTAGSNAPAAEGACAVQASLQAVRDLLVEAEPGELRSWDGVAIDCGDHSVLVAAKPIDASRIAIDLRAVDDGTGAGLGRLRITRRPPPAGSRGKGPRPTAD